MSGSNMILVIGALLLFGMFLSSSNKLMIGNTQIASQNEYNIAALSIAQSIIDEAKTKAFDEKTIAGPVVSPSPTTLTVTGLFGPDGVGESVPNPDTLKSTGYGSMSKFDDIDDYNKYNRLVNTPRAEGYRVSVTVGYASETNPDSLKGVPTFCKTMTVKVTSAYTSQPLTLSYAFTY